MRAFTLVLALLSFSVFGSEVADFELPIHNSTKQWHLRDYLGKKIIVLNFWASWCTSCIEELPELHALQQKYGKDAVFIGINAGERKKLIKKFLRKYDFQYTILEDKDKSIAARFHVDSLPQTIVIGKNRKVSFRGNRPPSQL